jgi:hypothetical protein
MHKRASLPGCRPAGPACDWAHASVSAGRPEGNGRTRIAVRRYVGQAFQPDGIAEARHVRNASQIARPDQANASGLARVRMCEPTSTSPSASKADLPELDTWCPTAGTCQRRRVRSQSSVHSFPDLVCRFQILSFGAVLRKGEVTTRGAERKMDVETVIDAIRFSLSFPGLIAAMKRKGTRDWNQPRAIGTNRGNFQSRGGRDQARAIERRSARLGESRKI